MDTTQPVDITPDPFGANCPNGADCTQHPHGHHRKHTTITAPDLLAEAEDQHLEAILGDNPTQDPNHAPGAASVPSRRAQDLPVEHLLALLRLANSWDSLDVAEDELFHHHRTEVWRQLLPAVYSAGFAAALGCPVTVAEDGIGLVVGERPELDSVETAARWIEASGIPVHPPAAVRAWLDGIGIRTVPHGIHRLLREIRRAAIAVGDVAFEAGRRAAQPEPIQDTPQTQDVPGQVLRELLMATGAFSDAAADAVCQAYQDERAAEIDRLIAIVHGYRRVVATSGLRRLVGAATTLERSLRGLTLPREVAAYLEQLREVLKATKVPDPEAAQEYLIWSHHHQMWFAPKASGYRRDITDAGRFTLAETAKWLDRGCKCCMVPEVAIPAPANEVFATPGAASKWAIEEIQRSTRARVELGVVNRWAGRSTSERGA